MRQAIEYSTASERQIRAVSLSLLPSNHSRIDCYKKYQFVGVGTFSPNFVTISVTA